MIDEKKDVKKVDLFFFYMKDKWWNDKAEQLQAAVDINNSKLLSNLLHDIYSQYSQLTYMTNEPSLSKKWEYSYFYPQWHIEKNGVYIFDDLLNHHSFS